MMIFCREFLPHETEHRAYSFCGTIEYMAPEVVRGGNHGHDIVSWKNTLLFCPGIVTGSLNYLIKSAAIELVWRYYYYP